MIAKRFDIGKTTTFEVTHRLTKGLVENYADIFIKWPTGARFRDVIDLFEAKPGFQGVIGAVDGSHISIKAPTENPNDYINRKKFHSVVLQATADLSL